MQALVCVQCHIAEISAEKQSFEAFIPHQKERRPVQHQHDWSFPSCFSEPHYESEVKCKDFHATISFVCV